MSFSARLAFCLPLQSWKPYRQVEKPLGDVFERSNDLIRREDVCIFGIHVEQVDRMRRLDPVETGLLRNDNSQIVAECVQDGSANASTRSRTADDDRVDFQQREELAERGAIECARLQFLNEDVARHAF